MVLVTPSSIKDRKHLIIDMMFTSSEVARMFHVEPKTIRGWAERYHIECVRTPGGHRRFTGSVVLSLLTQGGVSENDAIALVWSNAVASAQARART